MGNKIEELKARITHYCYRNQKMHIMVFYETKIKTDDDGKPIGHEYYSLSSIGYSHHVKSRRPDNPRGEGGGGLLVYVDRKYCKQVTDCTSKFITGQEVEAEIIVLRLRPHRLPREISCLWLIATYIPEHNVSGKAAVKIIDSIVHKIKSASPDGLIIVSGDFNRNPIGQLTRSQLSQLVTFPTRLESNAKLDLFLCSEERAYRMIEQSALGKSDHILFIAEPIFVPACVVQPRFKTIKVLNEEEMQCALETTDWSIFESHEIHNICQKTNHLNDVVTSYLNFLQESCSREKKLKIKKSKPWWNYKIDRLVRQRDVCTRLKDYSGAKQLRKLLKKEIQLAHKEFCTDIFGRTENPIQASFKCIQKLTGYRSKPPLNTECIPELKGLTTKEQCNNLNAFYARHSDGVKNDDLLLLVSPEPPAQEAPPVLQEQDVAKRLRRLKKKHSHTPDMLTKAFLKRFAGELAHIVCRLWNLSLKSGTYPWKLSLVDPNPKLEQPECRKDLRPVSNTSELGKELERVVLEHFLKYSDFDQNQFGYRSHMGTTDLATRLLDFALKNTDNSHNESFIKILLLDYSSAYDTVRHDLLVKKLLNLEKIPYWIIRWIISFLSGREQVVVLKDERSNKIYITIGVPQGSVISPVLFICFTDDLQLDDKKTKILKYADDSTLASVIKTQADHNSYLDRVQRIEEWSKENGLSLSADKTKELTIDFSKDKRLSKRFPQKTKINGEVVKSVSDGKLLGVRFQDNLKWDLHIKKVLIASNKRIFLLYRLKRVGAPFRILLNFYQYAVVSYQDYCCQVFSESIPNYLRKKLEAIRRRAQRVLNCKLERLTDRRKRLCYKKITSMLKHGVNTDLIPKNPNPRKGKTRVYEPHAKTNRYRNSFIPASIRMYIKQEQKRSLLQNSCEFCSE
eukprot:Lithocolla_globosa_v1_NODE_335_length_4412_cov_18.802846.p1 type:complete len:908 gc:universal NODE_335_length_4412_cov_18.802846:2840-117(-)